MEPRDLWDRYRSCLVECLSVGLSLDYSRMRFPDGFFDQMQPAIERAFDEMEALEAGAIANPDENRMVGHYWLRDPERAPSKEIADEIRSGLAAIKEFAQAVHAGEIKPLEAEAFRHLLIIGIGGSALGPQFVSRALGGPTDRMGVFFFDNTDPDGMDQVLERIDTHLAETLVVAVSKSGTTKESRNGMLEAEAAFELAGLDFGQQAVAITGEESELARYALADGWIARFPMWDWVGGRTSELAAVGLLPAALQGIDVDAMLEGARLMDQCTRSREVRQNPAAMMALMWHHAGGGHGAKDLVVLPYKDRLELFSRYLQQLVMESLGKERDRQGNVVHQGITVYGNKGSTDQHAYVQQLREGPNDFFVTFIEVLRDRQLPSIMVEEDVSSGDYLSGFLQGSRRALFEAERESMTITVEEVSPRTVGALIALFERAVGYYASLIDLNAYHQPGVEAGKVAAEAVVDLQRRVLAHLRVNSGAAQTAEQIAEAIGARDEAETVFWILRHLAANPDRGISKEDGVTVFDARYRVG
jgi:glucose-6-phosphate isomerase